MHTQGCDSEFGGPMSPISPIESESVFPSDNRDNLCDNMDEMSPDENGPQSSSDSQSDDGEEVWDESDESCPEECPELPTASQDSEEEDAIIQWLLIFLLRLQAKTLHPRCCCTMFSKVSFCVYLVDIQLP